MYAKYYNNIRTNIGSKIGAIIKQKRKTELKLNKGTDYILVLNLKNKVINCLHKDNEIEREM